MKRDVADPQGYLDALDPPQRAIVDILRDAIDRLAPEIEEGLRYGMLDYPGLANIGAQKRYVSLYVAPDVLARHHAAFEGVDRGKSCLRFRRLEDVDVEALDRLLADVLAFRRAADD